MVLTSDANLARSTEQRLGRRCTSTLEYDFGTIDGFKKRLLKKENQNVDFQKATGEVFTGRLKCAILLSRSPAPIEFRIEEITELFDCKKGYGKGKYGKSLGKYDKSNEYIKKQRLRQRQ